ncbi:hypothetical protein C8R47DRAFT_1112594 [Mycena vitilis]|nr:hypothetical protein C8R47DRAFT_1112594 [Mycena vitilis]
MSQDSSDSPGPERRRRSPTRHTPYPQTRPSQGRSRNENWNPMGPGQPGDFNSQYPPYDSSFSSGYDPSPAPFSNHQNRDHSRRLPALTAVSVDELSTDLGLNTSRRKAAHTFSKLSGEDRTMMLYLRLLGSEQQNDEAQEQIKAMQDHVAGIGEFCMQNWKPSKEQIKLFKALLKHYIIRPITSYTHLISIVETYIRDHAQRLRLELYKQDSTVKAVVHDVLVSENNSTRSALRKLVFASVKEKTPLMAFSKKLISGYHLPEIPSTPPPTIMASLALMRKVAQPLFRKTTKRGEDTGFWTNLEGDLDTLFGANGNDRSNTKWRQWEKDIIEEDDRRYNRYTVEGSARTQEEIDAAARSGGGDAAPSAADEEDDESALEDRQVNIDGLGDLAALSAASGSR